MPRHPLSLFTTILAPVLCWSCHDDPVIHATRKDLVETVYASGRVAPVDEYSQSAICTGRIIRKLVRDGDTVRKGQLLYLVSSGDVREKAIAAADNYAIAEHNLSPQSPRLADLALSLQNAQIRFTNDSLTYHRWQSLWEQHIGTRSNLDNCYSSYLVSGNEKKIAEQRYHAALKDLRVSRNNARAEAAAARQTLLDYSISSDRDGIVYQTFKETGESVRSSEVVALLGGYSRPMIRLAVDQQDIDKVRTGQTVLVQADATGNTIYEAVVGQIYPVMNELDQTFRVDAHFTGKTAPCFIHSSVEANIIVRQKKNILVLPQSVLSGQDSVLVYEKGRKRQVRVQTGIRTLDDVEIVSGITETTELHSSTKTGQP